MFCTFCTPDKFYVFDANKNKILLISKQEYDSLRRIEENRALESDFSVLEDFQKKVMRIGSLDGGMEISKVKKILNIGKSTAEHCSNCWAISFCTQCAAYADDLTENFSKEKRLSHCFYIKTDIINSFLDICFLKENNYDFYERVVN